LKSFLVYIIAFLMLSTSALYFLVAIFGERIESSEAHGLQVVEGQKEETGEPPHNENQEATQNQVHNESGGIGTEKALHKESASETQRRNLEFPLSISAGVGYAGIGLWMILDKRNSKIPYIVAIIGSLVLLGIYFTSRTVGISSLGKEPIGLLDTLVAALQVAIIAVSLYILFGKIYTNGVTVRK
jgi:hypothetical protein